MKHSKIFESDKSIPVILGGFVNALGLIRSFGAVDLDSVVIDRYRNIAFFSKYAKGFVSPHPDKDEESFIDFLMELGSRFRQKAFLLATNDIWLIPVSKRQKTLEKYFIFPMSEWKVIQNCIEKSKLYQFAINHNIPHPKTFFLQNYSEMVNISDKVVYPSIVKPSITVGFTEKLGLANPIVIINGKDELINLSRKIKEVGLGNVPLIIQEAIPGGAENLYTVSAYSNRDGEIIAYSTGHKIRQYPPKAGTITSGRVVRDTQTYELASKLIKAIGFYGISNTEFKYDNRDGIFKLIEINARPGMWNYSIYAAGINLPYLAYREAMGDKIEFLGEAPNDIVWYYLQDFLNPVIKYRFSKQNKEFVLSVGQWRESLKGKKITAIYRKEDPLPALIHFLTLFSVIIKGFFKRIFKRR